LSKEGGLCAVSNQSCCTYINQEKRVETDMQKIREKTQILHQMAQHDTSLGFSELWEKLTSWLPNLIWLKQLFIACIMLIVLGLLVCGVLQCFMWMCKQTSSKYEEWKKHKLRQNIESDKYFAKT
ncbi:ERVV1 protein, partial [Rhinoptilus africanus]|nr:ERVV1 protein [Rhinoptilus africanus]